MFHLFTHAFFKALLFLGSGSVMHAMGGVIDMRRFGGLRHRLPYTCWTFAVGALALAGLPPFAGFWSKDEILAALKSAGHAEGDCLRRASTPAIYWVATLTAFLTAFYTGRAFFLTFFGPEKLPSPDDPEALEEADAHAGDAHASSDRHHHRRRHPRPRVGRPGPLRGRDGRPSPRPRARPRDRLRGRSPHRPADLPPPTAGATHEPVPQAPMATATTATTAATTATSATSRRRS